MAILLALPVESHRRRDHDDDDLMFQAQTSPASGGHGPSQRRHRRAELEIGRKPRPQSAAEKPRW
jgi:hypothetical protein